MASHPQRRSENDGQARPSGLRPVRLMVADLDDPAVRQRVLADVEKLRGHASVAEGNRFTAAALADIDDWRA